ncbi:uncharacterized protein BJ212DRAFT_1481393 [Suillus subaureus]|uniref:Fe2OG dioxygenase domain-containing protein n=1 Tax=Suillus subaureus TaxID=48587 RepID=A0A9P7EA36_9AGAM|nr:uncharacterized protein BJ212DRAFT_1481393 [Suillus subaureus]KAG1815625.1 hypothetical protein BJ212DRAFT_1481393 [Suillus subaureus]
MTASRYSSTLAEDVRSDSTFRIPLIDFAAYKRATSLAEKRCIADDIVNGFKEVGFVYLTGHVIEPGTVDRVFQKASIRIYNRAEFFQLPEETKAKLAWDDPKANRGYVQVGRERVSTSVDAAEIASLRAKAPDTKESMEIGRENHPMFSNKWPQETEVPEFKQTMLHFFQTCHEVHTMVMKSIALGLDLPEDFFDNKIDRQDHNLRLLSYPPIQTSLLLGDGQARADYGTLTLLFQDSIGGLEVQNPHTEHYQSASPIPGTIVVNAGDLLARWSNNVLRSTLHRVVAPPAIKINATEGMTPARQSVAFFCNPNFDAIIESLPSCTSTANPSKYPPITTEQYIVGRLAATYEIRPDMKF